MSGHSIGIYLGEWTDIVFMHPNYAFVIQLNH